MSSSDLPKLLRSSVKSVHEYWIVSTHNLVKKCLFSLDAYLVSCPSCTKNVEWYLVHSLHMVRLLDSLDNVWMNITEYDTLLKYSWLLYLSLWLWI